jgi:uncharacterized protein (DUF1330 family)
MAAYFIVDLDVSNPKDLESYRRDVPATIEKYGGRFLVRGGAFEVLEGNWVPKRMVVIAFPTMQALKQWYASEDYRPLMVQRKSASSANSVAVEGV